MSIEHMKNQFSQEILNKISSTGLKPKVKSWLNSEIDQLSDIVRRYTEHPEMIEIPEDSSSEVKEARKRLRQNPLLIIDTILLSAESLYDYQELYKRSIFEIA